MTDKRVTVQTAKLPQFIYSMRAFAWQIAGMIEAKPDTKMPLSDWQHYAGLSIRDAAKLIGVHEGTYRNWQSGRNWPSSLYLPQMAKVFGCSIEELFYPPPGMRREK